MESKETTRLEAFSDGVFAISITLLGLDLKLPARSVSISLFQGLQEQWPIYLAFFVSFFTLLMMWYIHSVFFRFINKSNKEIFYANGLILMFTISIPFVTRLVAEFILENSAREAIIVYTAFGPIISGSYLWLIDAICRAKNLQSNAIPVSIMQKVRRKSSLGPVAYILSFILAFFYPYPALVINLGLNSFWAFTKLEFAE